MTMKSLDWNKGETLLGQGRDITRSRKKHARDNMQYRNVCKEKLMTGIYSPWEFLNSISRSLAKNFIR